MASKAIAGYAGAINAAGTGFTEVVNWKADISIKELEATSMGSGGWEEYITGLKGVSVSGTCQGTVIPGTGIAAMTLSTSTVAGSITISGTALLGRVSIGVPVDGKVTYDFDAKFTGAVSVS